MPVGEKSEETADGEKDENNDVEGHVGFVDGKLLVGFQDSPDSEYGREQEDGVDGDHDGGEEYVGVVLVFAVFDLVTDVHVSLDNADHNNDRYSEEIDQLVNKHTANTLLVFEASQDLRHLPVPPAEEPVPDAVEHVGQGTRYLGHSADALLGLV